MPQIVVNLTDDQYARARSAVAKHIGLKTPEIRSVKGEIVSAAADRVAQDSELEAFLIEHIRQMVMMVERENAVVSF